MSLLDHLFARVGFVRLNSELSTAAAKQAAFQAHTSLVHAILKRYAVDCVIDVGANEGQFAASLRARRYRGPIISFEPVAEAFRALAQRASSDSAWQVRLEALGARDETREIRVMRRSEFSSFLTPVSQQPSQSAGKNEVIRTESVKVRRLDSLEIPALASARHIFVKMDTQGFDLEVFAGATGLLPRVVALQSEISMVPIYEGMPNYSEALAQYDAAGFVLASLVPVVRDADTLIPLECDCLLLRRV